MTITSFSFDFSQIPCVPTPTASHASRETLWLLLAILHADVYSHVNTPMSILHSFIVLQTIFSRFMVQIA